MKALARRGLTLMELLVALAIGSMIIAAVLAVLTSAQRTQDLGERRSDLLQSVRVSLNQIERDLQVAVLRTDDPQFEFLGGDEVEGGIPMDSIEFASASGAPLTSVLPTGDLLRVQYFIDIDDTTEHRGFVRTAMTMPLPEEIPPEQEELSARTYCPWAVGLDATYYDSTEQTWVEDWQERTDLPTSVRVVLYVLVEPAADEAEGDLEDVIPFSTVVHLMLAQVPLGTGQVESAAQTTTDLGELLESGEPGEEGLPEGAPPSIPIPTMPGVGGLPGLPAPGGDSAR